ncbi:uncharacterized protein Dwil_GK24363 [Drosophila willistoni]|uniref:Uncharacterized protein n=1 Tax=Drosophila willistoni TaxID=7260 RepID=B4MZJ8_DROWI|nr:GATA zinc finger domain-containing protein 10 [Drosophila willistoni]EDW77783.2 uncharacterized protein Dwil_GK24363 [Drosophila willistoni]
MSTSHRSSNAGSFQQGKPGVSRIPPNGLVVYGNGLVFGGNVYPVLVDGVPMSLPAAAQEAAAMQRFGMQLLGQPQQPQSYGQKPGIQQPPEASFGQSAQNLPRQLQQLPRQQQHQLLLQQQQQQLQLQQLPPQQQQQQQQQWQNSYGNMRAMDSRNGSDIAMMPSPQMFNYNHDYGYVPTGAESSGWNGYASCQPMDASKPFAFGWSPTD